MRVKRQEEILKLAEELLTDIELSRIPVEHCLLKASRLARLVGDDEAIKFIRFELHGYDGSKEAGDLMSKVCRWKDRSKNDGWWASISRMEAVRATLEATLNNNNSPNLSGDDIIGALRMHYSFIKKASEQIVPAKSIASAVMAELYEFTSRAYDELYFSETQSDLFEKSRTSIDTRLIPLVGDSLKKIESINDRLHAGDTESISQAMNTCRRLIDSAADSLFPARSEPAIINGQQLKVTKQNVLNRINVYVAHQIESKGRQDRIRRTIADIYDRVSTGVHSDISTDEAKYLFLATYVILGEIINLPVTENS